MSTIGSRTMTRSRAISDIDMVPELRLAKREDLGGIAALEEQAFAEPWYESALELFLNSGNFAVIALSGGIPVSYCTVTTILDEAQVINVATDSAHRGRGYAETVLDRVLDECASRGISSVSLEVRVSNEPAISLYSKLGFIIAGRRRDFYRAPREDAFVMIKNIE